MDQVIKRGLSVIIDQTVNKCKTSVNPPLYSTGPVPIRTGNVAPAVGSSKYGPTLIILRRCRSSVSVVGGQRTTAGRSLTVCTIQAAVGRGCTRLFTD